MATEINGIIYTNEVPKPWTTWRQCFIVQKKESIAEEMIRGFVWTRKCDGIYEIPRKSGWFYVPGKQYAKTRKEIFMYNLKETSNGLVV